MYIQLCWCSLLTKFQVNSSFHSKYMNCQSWQTGRVWKTLFCKSSQICTFGMLLVNCLALWCNNHIIPPFHSHNNATYYHCLPMYGAWHFYADTCRRSSVISVDTSSCGFHTRSPTSLRPGSPVSMYTAFGSLPCTYKHNVLTYD